MKQRVITGAVWTVVVLAAILTSRWAMFALLSVMLVMSVEEVYRATRATGIEPVRWAGYMYCGLTILAFLVSFFVNRNRSDAALYLLVTTVCM